MIRAIKVLQYVSFMIQIRINFTPISKMLLTYMFTFSTFKVLPPELIDHILQSLGISTQNEGFPQTASAKKRLLEAIMEREITQSTKVKPISFAQNMNLILVAGVAFVLFLFISLGFALYLRNNKKKQ